MDALLKIISKKPGLKLLNKTKLKQKIRDIDDEIPMSVIDKYYDERELTQIYKRPRPVKEKSLQITAPRNSFQIDIISLTGYKKYNNNIDKFLLLVEITSRKAWAYPLKTGGMGDVLNAYDKFIDDLQDLPLSVAGDAFFNNAEFIDFNNDLSTNVYTDVAKDDHITRRSNKLGVIDRTVRTLKQMIQKYMLENKNLRWTTYLKDVIEQYNDTPNSGMKDMTPDEIYDDDLYMEKLHEARSKKNKETFKSFGFSIGDKVRVLTNRKQFEKEKASYSTEIYTIEAQQGYKYILKGEDGKFARRMYKPNELQKVGVVTNRVDTGAINSTQKQHKAASNLSKDTGLSYVEADSQIDKQKGKALVNQRGVIRSTDRVTRSGRVS